MVQTRAGAIGSCSGASSIDAPLGNESGISTALDDFGTGFSSLRLTTVAANAPSEVPEPGTVALMALAMAGFALSRKTRR